MIVLPNDGTPLDAPRRPPEPEATVRALVRFGDVLAAVQLRRDPDAAAEATPHVADVFNAHGFFADGATPTSSAAPVIEEAVARGRCASPTEASVTLETPALAVDAGAATGDPVDAAAASEMAAGSATTEFPTFGVARRRLASVPPASTVGQVGKPGPVAPSGLPHRVALSEGAPTSLPRPASRAPVRPAPHAATEVPQVVVHVGETGVEVAARVDRIGNEARATLRARIAALLSRHGFSGGVVRLIGGTATRKG